ncbi:FeS assembly SUF system protein SufT [Pelobium manganitolerans]|uniref:FeS assembly SUF system protein SufT n=1 Tax=Pelobium manganitolerans TaxID=1842495 RepID=A0A419SB97_9SPHI|nr:metal-sulfur cluster assembly factor [Pelobium manganitolerans]RKD20067.1 FeS assembly SUF system protein SufT [Pelobium manganitolerans]
MNVATNNELKSTIALTGLYHVMDPEIGLNIVDLGLVYEIRFNEPFKEITVVMTLTTQFCPMGESIVDATKQAMQQSFPDYSTEVELVFEPAWSPDKISEEGNKYLNG